MCLNVVTPVGTQGKLMVLGVPILKLFKVSLFCDKVSLFKLVNSYSQLMLYTVIILYTVEHQWLEH